MRVVVIAAILGFVLWQAASYAIEQIKVSPVATQLERRGDLSNSL